MEKSVEIPGQETHRYLAVHHLLPVPSHRHTAPACNPSPTDGRCASIGISTTNSCSAETFGSFDRLCNRRGGEDYVFEGIIGESAVFSNPFFLSYGFAISSGKSDPFSRVEFKSKSTVNFNIRYIFRTIRYFIITNNYIGFLTK